MPARHRFHGDPTRFTAVVDVIENCYGNSITYIADVAGGQGMLARLLAKRGYIAEVVDPAVGLSLVFRAGKKNIGPAWPTTMTLS